MKTSVKYQVDADILKRYPGMRTNILAEMAADFKKINGNAKFKLSEKTEEGDIFKPSITTFTLKKCNNPAK